jgi:hypothetical protein
MTNTKQNSIMKAIRNSKGRFFGLYTKTGEAINAQFSKETPSYVTVYDRNHNKYRKLAKTSLTGLRLEGKRIGSVS